MKKIVGILGMAAMLSASAFALDVTASLKIEGSLLNVNEDGKASALKTNTGTPAYAGLSFAAAGDVAGASFNIAIKDAKGLKAGVKHDDWTGAAGADDLYDAKVIDFTGSDGKIWVKPFANALNNALTLNVGKVGALSAGKYGVGGDVGFLADYNNADLGLTVDFVMNAGNYWFNGQNAQKVKTPAKTETKMALDLASKKMLPVLTADGEAAFAKYITDGTGTTYDAFVTANPVAEHKDYYQTVTTAAKEDPKTEGDAKNPVYKEVKSTVFVYCVLCFAFCFWIF